MKGKHKNPWQKKSSRQVYENPWISVHHDEVITPTGTDGIYGRIVFKNIALAIIPMDEDNNTWLIGQYRYTLDEYTWEIPMGGGPLAEDKLESAKRELQEETGITAKDWKCILRIHTSNCVTDEEGFVYVAKDLSFGETSFDSTEDLQIKKVPFDTAIQMIDDGKITDAISIAGLLKMKSML